MNYQVTFLKPFGVMISPKSGSPSISDLEISLLKEHFQNQQLILLRGFQNLESSHTFIQYAEAWGEVSVWPFGKVLELVKRENPEDHIFDHSYVPMHWDGMYRPQVPEYQLFHCVQAPQKEMGGETLFSNTLVALKNLPLELKRKWEKISITYLRKMEFYHSQTTSPLIFKHPYRDHLTLRYNEPHDETKGELINHPKLNVKGIEEKELSHFHQELREIIYSPQNLYSHQWQTGDVVIADNFSLLHGRERFTQNANRHLRRIQVLSDIPFNNPHLESYQ